MSFKRLSCVTSHDQPPRKSQRVRSRPRPPLSEDPQPFFHLSAQSGCQFSWVTTLPRQAPTCPRASTRLGNNWAASLAGDPQWHRLARRCWVRWPTISPVAQTRRRDPIACMFSGRDSGVSCPAALFGSLVRPKKFSGSRSAHSSRCRIRTACRDQKRTIASLPCSIQPWIIFFVVKPLAQLPAPSITITPPRPWTLRVRYSIPACVADLASMSFM